MKGEIMSTESDLWNQPIGAFKRKRPAEKANGYAGRPGAGPEGETCKTCQHLVRVKYGKTYIKCNVIRASWTSGPGTDIRAKTPSCQFWKAIEKPKPESP